MRVLFQGIFNFIMDDKKTRKIRRYIIWIVSMLIVFSLIGSVGKWYGSSINCAKCMVGLPNFFTLVDMDDAFFCFAPSHCPVSP